MFDQTKASVPNLKSSLLGNVQLLTTETLAEMLHRTPAGLRATLQTKTKFAGQLRSARVRLGRRVLFRGDLIDQIIADATGT